MGGMLSVWEDGKRTDRMPTLQEVQAHIGLTTNASTKTNKQWLGNLGTQIKEEASRRIRRTAEQEKEEQEKARGNLVNAIINQDEVVAV